MSIIAKLHIEDKTFNLLKFNFSLNQKAGINGFPSAKPTGGIFNIVFETTKDALFFEWMISENTMQNLKIVLSPSAMNSKSRTIELLDAYCIKHQENFDGINNEPMMTYIQVSPAIMVQDGTKIFEWYWKVTDLNANVTPTVIDNEPEIIRQYITDFEDNEINDYKTGDTILIHLETKNSVGEKITLSLNDKTQDFKYNGTILKNDTLKDYHINNDIEQIELEVIDQQN